MIDWLRLWTPVWCLMIMVGYGHSALGQIEARDSYFVQDSARSAMVNFAVSRLDIPDGVEVLVQRKEGYPPQGFAVIKGPGDVDGDQLWLVDATDDHGLMYGILDLAESLRLGLDPAKVSSPDIHRRGLKFNIPLDARAPSYDDTGDAAFNAVEQVWDRTFWEEFLDRMAEHRYNVLTLWSNHPFTTMVKLEDYPDVALPDVAVRTFEVDEYELLQYYQANLRDPKNFKVIKKMTMDEKIAHWRYVMRYAKERGIDIYFITWNVWVHGAEGKYGITADQTNENTTKYFRRCMEQMVLTYPDLKGFGITAGEHMQNKLEGENATGNWFWKTYGLGIKDALAQQPGREFDFIYRVWYTGLDEMKETFIDKYTGAGLGQVDIGFKYARARLYSMADPPWFNNQLRDEAEANGLASWMNLRNDDIFNFRWGDPEYVRSFMENLPPEPTLAGYHMGSDGYVWTREFTSTEPESPRQLEIDKHWYNFMLWGRLGYDRQIKTEFFEKKLGHRYPTADAAKLYETWQTASKIVPLVNLAHWRDWDHMWSVETCYSKKEGYHTVDHFIEFGPISGQNMVSIAKHVEDPDQAGRSPFDIADELDALAAEVFAGLELLRSGTVPPPKELRLMLGDIEAFAHLAAYYADKFRGSTQVHRFRVAGEEAVRAEAIKHLEAAVVHWKAYGRVASAQYETQMLARVATTDWLGVLLKHAEADIEMARNAKPGVFPESVMYSNNPDYIKN
ncbi:MAG: carbohydrate-binding family 6 protein [Planctomycetota bacterium]